MRNEIFVNVGPCETRVAVREADQITELHIERPNERGVGGGIYKGRVSRVLPGMQAAFVDIGIGLAARSGPLRACFEPRRGGSSARVLFRCQRNRPARLPQVADESVH